MDSWEEAELSRAFRVINIIFTQDCPNLQGIYHTIYCFTVYCWDEGRVHLFMNGHFNNYQV